MTRFATPPAPKLDQIKSDKKITDEEVLKILETPLGKPPGTKPKNKKKKKKSAKKAAAPAAAEEEEEEEEDSDDE